MRQALTETGAPVDRVDGKTHIKNPIRFTNEPAQLSHSTPEYGEHTDWLDKEGMS